MNKPEQRDPRFRELDQAIARLPRLPGRNGYNPPKPRDHFRNRLNRRVAYLRNAGRIDEANREAAALKQRNEQIARTAAQASNFVRGRK